MEAINMEVIITVVTAIVTYVFGVLAKKFEWIESKYIPVQNLVVGILAGFLSYSLGLAPDLTTALMLCLFASLGAGGTHDLTHINKE